MLNHIDFTIAPSNIPTGVMIQLINKAGSRIRSIIISSYRAFQLSSTFKQLSLPLLSSITIIGHIRESCSNIAKISESVALSSIKLTTTCSCIWMVSRSYPINRQYRRPALSRPLPDKVKQRFQCQGIAIDGNCGSCHSRHVTIKTCSKCQQSYCIKCVVDKFQHCPSCTFTGGSCRIDQCTKCHATSNDHQYYSEYHSRHLVQSTMLSSYWNNQQNDVKKPGMSKKMAKYRNRVTKARDDLKQAEVDARHAQAKAKKDAKAECKNSNW
jgi:hypothetical protein